MNKYEIYGKFLACTPFPKPDKLIAKKSALNIEEQNAKLIALETVFGNALVVYIRESRRPMPWAKEVFELDGIKFIVVPENEIVLTKTILETNG